MKLSKRMAATAACCSLAAILGIGGTIAYLTDRTEATNNFTFGDVKVDTLEPDWDTTDTDGDGVPDAAEAVLPNQQIPKSVVAKNVGVNDAVVFLKVTVPLENVTKVSGNTLDKRLQEIFYFQGKSDAVTTQNNHFNNGWVNIPEAETGYTGAGGSESFLDLNATKTYSGTTRTYVFGYEKRIAKNEETTTLFDKVQIKNMLENELPSDGIKNIHVETYAIQADSLSSADGAIDTTGTLGHDTLKTIYDLYVGQMND